MIRNYTTLCRLKTFEERFAYLRLDGKVGAETFGFDRYLNQAFYSQDPEWKRVRDKVIIRDCGCDLGHPDHEIHGVWINGVYKKPKILIHHMNPISKMDILDATDILLNPEYLISVTRNTHNAIHYGDRSLLVSEPITRSRYDTCPWKR